MDSMIEALKQKRKQLQGAIPENSDSTVSAFLDKAHSDEQNYDPSEPRNIAADYMETPALRISKDERQQQMQDLPYNLAGGMLGSVGTMENVGGKVISMMSPEAQAMRNKLDEIRNPSPAPVAQPEQTASEKFMNRFGDSKTDASAFKAKKGMDYAQQQQSPYVDVGSLGGGTPTFPNSKFSITEAGQEIGPRGIAEPFNSKQLDPLPWMDNKHGIMKGALADAKNKNIPVKINTSSDLIATDDYIGALPQGSEVNVYMPTKDSKLNSQLFPGNASRTRMETAVQKLKESGVKVNAIEPTEESIRQAVAAKTKRPGQLEFGEQSDLDQALKQPGVFPLRVVK